MVSVKRILNQLSGDTFEDLVFTARKAFEDGSLTPGALAEAAFMRLSRSGGGFDAGSALLLSFCSSSALVINKEYSTEKDFVCHLKKQTELLFLKNPSVAGAAMWLLEPVARGPLTWSAPTTNGTLFETVRRFLENTCKEVKVLLNSQCVNSVAMGDLKAAETASVLVVRFCQEFLRTRELILKGKIPVGSTAVFKNVDVYTHRVLQMVKRLKGLTAAFRVMYDVDFEVSTNPFENTFVDRPDSDLYRPTRLELLLQGREEWVHPGEKTKREIEEHRSFHKRESQTESQMPR